MTRRARPELWSGRAAARSTALALLLILPLLGCGGADRDALVLWHAYRGAEAEALRSVVDEFRERNPELDVDVVSVPNEAYAGKLTSAVPRGNGPDVFIFAHERAPDWARSGIVRPFGSLSPPLREAIPEPLRQAVTVDGALYGVPLATKTLALYVHRGALQSIGAEIPETTDELVQTAMLFSASGDDRYGLAYEAANFYFHSPWMYGFGGRIFDGPDAPPRLDRPGNAESLAFAHALRFEYGLLPAEPDGALVRDLFARGAALFAINGPWFAAELPEDVDYEVVPLPVVSSTGLPARPFVTVESAFLTGQVTEARLPAARALVEHLAGASSSRTRATVGRQIVAMMESSERDDARDPFIEAFSRAAELGVPIPPRPEMTSVWEPANGALRQVLRGTRSPQDALDVADRRLARLLAPPPTAANPTPYLAAVGLLGLLAAFLAVRRARRTRFLTRARASKTAYLYIAPAVVASVVLIFVPFFVGAGLSFFAHRYGEFTFVGLSHYARIILSGEYAIDDPYSFYFTLAVTVLWTALNVFLHVTIGLALALVLRDPWVKLKGVYRVLLIIPWAVPNYITALIWKGMFNVEFGAINKILALFGVTPVDWFSRFATAFAANLATNTWLGFPFMMVVSLGALQSIPRELEEAAEVDGASRWQRFRHIVWPLLRPALVPAIVLGTVWTFNMFNVIYLVSGGEPDGSTEILISEAYRWAFSRQNQYGYAAAYGVLIFLVLFIYTRLTQGDAAMEGER